MIVSVEEVVQAFGDALVAPSLGEAELIVAALVALVFLWSVVRSLFGDDEDGESSWRQRRS